MIRSALRRAATSTRLLVVGCLLFTVGVVGGTYASFNAEVDTQTATFAGGYVAAPTNPTLSASGYDGILAWTTGTTGVLNQAIYVQDRNGNDSCNNSYATTVSTTEPSTESTYTDTGRASDTSLNGDYFCYEIDSTYNGWDNPTTVGPLQLGLVPVSVSVSNGGTSGDIDDGDTITVTFNQNLTLLVSGSIQVQACSNNGQVRIGDSNCSGFEDFGILQGLTIGATAKFNNSTIDVSGNTVVVTLNSGGHSTSVSGSATFKAQNGEDAVETAVGGAVACYSGANCQPDVTGSF
jgi:hypothetical protein